MNPLYDEVFSRAALVAKTSGGIDYMKERAAHIVSTLAEKPGLPEQITVREPNRGLVSYDVSRREIASGTRRRIDAQRLRTEFPEAHRAAVTTIPPERPYQLRLDCTRGGRRSVEWTEMKALGRAGCEAFMNGRFADETWNPGTFLRALHLLRSETRLAEQRLTARRDELIEFVLDHDLPLTMTTGRDGQVTLRANPRKTEIDYDLLEKKFPEASSLIVTSPAGGGTRILFHETVVLDDPEEDEENVVGIWK